ncbi:MAG: hypothetical protein IJ689_04275 [Alphaproteobacteria bacterium]|nr:hypothetical protein [Alphaproteobacteria bacterium]
MKNYILMLGIAGVAFGSYAAYAGNSATMTITVRIEHDVSLTLEGNTMDFGTIYIDPSNSDGGKVLYNESGAITRQDDYIVSASPVTPINFTANIPNPSACNNASTGCGGLSLSNDGKAYLGRFSHCGLYIKYTGTENKFKLRPTGCVFDYPDEVPLGDYSDTITITYNAS